MSEELSDAYAALEIVRREEGVGRRARAEDDFAEAQSIAKRFGFEFIRFNEAHYRLRDGEKRYDVYPGNQRITRKPGGEFLKMPADRDWTLIDVAAAYAEVVRC